jgi:hypothetical protein
MTLLMIIRVVNTITVLFMSICIHSISTNNCCQTRSGTISQLYGLEVIVAELQLVQDSTGPQNRANDWDQKKPSAASRNVQIRPFRRS